MRQNDIVSVSYNGGPLMRPTIHDQERPGHRVDGGADQQDSLGFMKGDKDRTIVLISDAVGQCLSNLRRRLFRAAF